MPTDIASLLFALAFSMSTMAIALPAVMGQVNAPARQAQIGIALQALGWILLLFSGEVEPGSWSHRLLSTLSMAGIAGGLAFNAAAFNLWCGRSQHPLAPTIIAIVMPIGYGLGFSSYAFRVCWANGLLALQMGLVAATLWRKPEVAVGRWRWLLIVALLIQLLVTGWRSVLAVFYSQGFPTLLTSHPVNIVSVLAANATAMLSLIGILLAHRDEAARALERLATIDGLTGVLNRRAWLLQAETALAISQRYGHPCVVLMIDLDHFKQINDTRGHEAGDRALQFVARALQAAVRPGDLVGRYGGEEFCLLMNHAELAAAAAFDRRMRAYLAEAAAQDLGFELNYSAGVAMRTTAEDSLSTLLRRADGLLYNAKALGRARTLDSQGLAVREL